MRKFFLIGIVVALLIAIPLTVYILTTQKTKPNINAAPSTLLSFTIPSSPATVGTPVAIPIAIDPTGGGSSPNQVSFVKLSIQYDGNKLQAANNYFVPDQKMSTLEGPTNNCDSTNHCTISATLSTGADPNNTISSQTTIATLNFNPLAATDTNNPTQLIFASGSQALSIASSDKPAENVLASSRLQPGLLTIVGAATTGTPTPSPTLTITPTITPTPTSGGGGGGSTPTPTPTAPIFCTSLTVDHSSGSTAPFTVLFTAVGGSNVGNITSVSFNFGDGIVQNIASGSGIGSSSVSVQQSHIYNSNGTYTATVVLTDDHSNSTAVSSCSQTISIGIATPTPTISSGSPTPTSKPKIPPTGPGEIFVGAGIAGVAMTIVGVLIAIGL